MNEYELQALETDRDIAYSAESTDDKISALMGWLTDTNSAIFSLNCDIEAINKGKKDE